jgi:hypothetical protein
LLPTVSRTISLQLSGPSINDYGITWSILHIWGRREMHTEFWWGNLKERDHLEDPRINERIILKWVLKK